MPVQDLAAPQTTGRHLVVLETSGTQDYLRISNRRRALVGASRLVSRLGDWARSAAEEGAGEVIVATSALAVLHVDRREQGTAIVGLVTARALREAPGLEVVGVVSPERLHLDDAEAVAEELTRLAGLRRAAQVRRPGPALRFQRLPIVAECRTTGLPAARLLPDPGGGDPRPLSEVAVACEQAGATGAVRLQHDGRPLVRDIRDIEEVFGEGTGEGAPSRLDWLGVVHADVNGLGQLVRSLRSSDDLVTTWREASQAIDAVVELALKKAVAELDSVWSHDAEKLPFVPLVIGGDDVTFLCPGRLAPGLAVRYLSELEAASRDDARLEPFFTSGWEGLTAAAGVAVVKPHFPFTLAARLADALTASAKRAKHVTLPIGESLVSSIDVHVHHDASGAELSTIREHLELDEGRTTLAAGPWVVDEDRDARLRTIEEALRQRGHGPAAAWIEARRWSKLKERAGASDELSGSARHRIRTALFEGRPSAEGQIARERATSSAGIDGLLAGRPSPFWPEPISLEDPDGDRRQVSDVLDALELRGFLA